MDVDQSRVFNEEEEVKKREEKERIKLEKRQVRQGYRSLIATTEANRKELMNPTNNGLLENVEKANELFKKVFGTNEATMDARVLVNAADLGVQKAKQLRMGQGGFDENEYVTRLISKMGGHEIDNEQQAMDWTKVGKIAMKWSRKVPTMDFLLGPMAVEHKTRTMAQRTRVVRDPKAMRKPQELREEDIARQENETTKNVMQVNNILEELNRKVNLFELVINPESFGQTVENIFYLSFLVRDGKASILEVDMADPNLGDVDEDGEPWVPAEGANVQPMVELTEVPTAEDYQGGLLKKQMVLEIDMATWRHLIEVYGIRRTLIPTRVSREAQEKGKWYG
ncbi:nuclear protein [Mortierella hygrophila]|uniref:Non-structural maintenance of chromosomes element 4 n=1 Tax=Mortierella hygrophila TaxID=979708 RepID=A0A9P6F9P5_9FUNG|nr:nuclear protein [Mortierella hygrophila]